MNVLFLGDSITDSNHCFTPDNLGNGFVKLLASLLPHCRFTNGGTDGFTFPRIYGKWKSMYQGNCYDAAVILGGINDVSCLFETRSDPLCASRYLEHSADSLLHLLHGLHKSGTDNIILVEPFLFDEFGWTCAWLPEFEKICSMIRSVAQDHAMIISFMDYLCSHPHTSPLSADGVHLTGEGEKLLAEMLVDYF